MGLQCEPAVSVPSWAPLSKVTICLGRFPLVSKHSPAAIFMTEIKRKPRTIWSQHLTKTGSWKQTSGVKPKRKERNKVGWKRDYVVLNHATFSMTVNEVQLNGFVSDVWMRARRDGIHNQCGWNVTDIKLHCCQTDWIRQYSRVLDQVTQKN